MCGRLAPGLDGVSDYVVKLAEALVRRGAAVRILHLGEGTGRDGARSVGTRWSPRAMLAAARAARGADLVHVQFAPSMTAFRPGLGFLPLVLRGRRLVTTLHEYDWWRFERLLPVGVWRVLERFGIADRETALLVPRSAAVVTTNPAHAAAVMRRFAGRVRPRSVPIGANVGVAPAMDRATARAALLDRLGIGPAATVVAFFGFVHPVKGVRYLAEAVALLAAQGRDVHALVVGGFESLALPGPEARSFEAELREQVASTGVEERLHITGYVSEREASRLLAGADVGVLPLTHGTTAKSGSLLTLLAHGLPTAVTAGPEPDPELADGDRVVVIGRVRDGAAIAEALRRLLDDPALASAVAGRGRSWAAERDWGVVAGRHLDLYREVLTG